MVFSAPVRLTSKLCKQTTRGFLSSSSAASQVSLDEEFPNVPSGNPSKAPKPQVESVKTASGLQVTADSADSHLVTLGVYVNAGTQSETESNSGISHLMKNLAFRCTDARSDLRLYRDIEQIGGTISSSFDRSSISMNITVLPEYVNEASEILAESLLSPRFAKWDIDMQKKKIACENELYYSEPLNVIKEGLHSAAYYDTTPLGQPMYNIDELENLNQDKVLEFYNNYYNANGMALVGLGVDSGLLTDVANEYFQGVSNGSAPAVPATKYVGGEFRKKVKTNQTFVALALEGAAADSSNYNASLVASAILSKRFANVKNVETLSNSYNGTGLFGVAGKTNGDNASEFVDQLIAGLKGLSSVTSDEVAAGKASVKSNYAYGYENRDVRVKTLGSQTFGKGVASVEAVVQAMDSVTPEQVQDFVQGALKSNPSIASAGKLSQVARYSDIVSKVQA